MLLMLNKRDLFEKKLDTVPLKDWFPEFPGPNTYEAAQKWLEKQFHSRSPAAKNSKGQAVYTYCTTAVDSNNIRAVLDSVKDTVVRQLLTQMGMV